MLDRLPLELLATIVSKLGERPDALRTCKTTWRLYNDTTALILWLERTFGASGALLTFTSVRCVASWPEARVLRAMQQMIHNGCNLGDTTQAGCVLYWATKRGMASVLDLLLTRFSLPAWLNSLLKTAAAQGHHGCVSVLLNKDADPNVDGGRPLKAATEAASVECVRALLDAGADLHAGGECALRLCAAAGSPFHMQVMALLLERGADVHAKADEALSLAVERSNAEAVALLLQHGANASARQVLETAASTGCAKVVRLLLSHGAPPDADGGRPLRAAAEAGAVEVVRQLLDAGARCGNSGGMGGGGRGGAGRKGALGRPSLEMSVAPGSGGVAGSSVGSGLRGLRRQMSWTGSSGEEEGLVGLVERMSGGEVMDKVKVCACGKVGTGEAWAEGVDVVLMGEEMGVCQACGGLLEEDGEGEEREGEEEEGWYGAGGAALHAALCAGEAEVARVLLERGARVDLATLRCWRQWYRYPGVMAVLQRHRPLGCSPSCVLVSLHHQQHHHHHQHQQHHTGNQCGRTSAPQLRPTGVPPLATGPNTYRHISNKPPTASGNSVNSWASMYPFDRATATLMGTSLNRNGGGADGGVGAAGLLAGCSACGAREGCGLFCLPVLQQQLREALVAAAGEGAEAAVQLFLTWGAPVPITNPVTAVAINIAAQTIHSNWAAATCSTHPNPPPATPTPRTPNDTLTPPSGVHPRSTTARGGDAHVCLGLFTPECLSTALSAAAAANRPVIVRQLLQHHPEPAWAKAILHPSALHVAVADGHLEVVRLLLDAGMADITLQPTTAPPPTNTSTNSTPFVSTDACSSTTHTGNATTLPFSAPNHSPFTSFTTSTHTTAGGMAHRCHSTAPTIPTDIVSSSPLGIPPTRSSLSLASLLPALPPTSQRSTIVTSSGLVLGVGGDPIRAMSTPQLPITHIHTTSAIASAAPPLPAPPRPIRASTPTPTPTTTSAHTTTVPPHMGSTVGVQYMSPPPPPLQMEAWGTVVLCAAGGCKAGSKAAVTITSMLLDHGFGSCAQDALRLVSCGRVPTWREGAASAILAAAFARSAST